jgi:predicted nucleic acid-binding protein
VRPPSSAVVVDSAILVSALIGRTAGAIFDVSTSRRLYTTDRAMIEVSRRVALGMRRPDLLPALDALLRDLDVVAVEDISPSISAAEFALRNSVPSRNGSDDDAHILALAWELEADIWSHDRDFAGTGVSTWSTINLVKALAEPG